MSTRALAASLAPLGASRSREDAPDSAAHAAAAAARARLAALRTLVRGAHGLRRAFWRALTGSVDAACVAAPALPESGALEPAAGPS